jgi:carbamoylphosphate synthase large subunit
MQKRGHTVAISSEETNLICGENKIVFKEWMLKNGFERFIPKTYNSPEEAKLPCVVKLRPITGTDSNGVIIVKTPDELKAAVARHRTGEPLLIQEVLNCWQHNDYSVLFSLRT